MDYMMPVMDGIETTKKLRELGYNGVIIALTANALTGNDEMFKKNGFNDFISKPIDIRQLNTCLIKYIHDRYPEEAEKYKINNVDSTQTGVNPKLLDVFCRDAEKAVATIKETIANNDIKLFTTTVHAMKSALGNIGESKASDFAFSLEKAGIDGDLEFIFNNAESFIQTLESLIKCLRPIEAVNDDAEISEDKTYLTQQLLIVKAACEDYDDEAAYKILDSLKEKQWKKDTFSVLENIREMLFFDSNFEGVCELIMEFFTDYQDKE